MVARLSVLAIQGCLAILVCLSCFVLPAGAQTASPDMNSDGVVDEADLLLFAEQWQNVILDPEVASLPGGVTMAFVQIPAGSFVMGSSETSPLWSTCSGNCERPRHEVTFAEPFYLGVYEVTQIQWRAIMDDNPSFNQNCGPDCPVEQVLWTDITGPGGFLERLNALGQGTFRLPSEAEWEYAARAGTDTRFPFGDAPGCDPVSCSVPCAPLEETAWTCGNSGLVSQRTGQKDPNPWGLFDMSGNVSEWVQDLYHTDYAGAPADGSAWVTGGGPHRVTRGGSFLAPPALARPAARSFRLPDSSPSREVGFRLVREIEGNGGE